MKNQIIYTFILVSFLLVGGCNKKSDDPSPVPTSPNPAIPVQDPAENTPKIFESISLQGLNGPDFGSFFNASTGVVFKYDKAKENATLVDFVYYYSNQAHVLTSPSDSGAAQVYSDPNLGISKWSVKNTTQIRETQLTDEEFEKVTSVSVMINYYNSGQVVTSIKGTPQSPDFKIYSFKTTSGKYGLIRCFFAFALKPYGDTAWEIKIQK